MDKILRDELRYSMFATLLPETKKSPYYKRSYRNRYRRTKGYIPWETMAVSLVGQLVVAEQMGSKFLKGDPVLGSTTVCSWLFAHEEVPVYCLEPKLYQSFVVTDLPSDIGKIERILPHGIILLPQGLLKNPDGDEVDWIMFQHILKGENFDPIRLKKFSIFGESSDENRLRVITTSLTGCAYSSVVYLGDEPMYGDIVISDSVFSAGSNTEVDAEERFTKKLSNLVFQFLLFLDGYPEHIDTQKSDSNKENTRAKTGGFGGGKAASDAFEKVPIRVGVNFKVPSPPKKPHQGGTHASPRCHWRMGHYRKVQEGRLVKVKPAIVNAWNVRED